MSSKNDPPSSRLADRFAILDVQLRWCRAIDRLDFASMAEVFHPDAFDDHGAYKGDIPGLIDWLQVRHRNIVFCMHQMTNVLVEFADDDNALVEAYLTVTQRFAPGTAGDLLRSVAATAGDDAFVDVVSRSRYIDRVQRRGGQWKVHRRTFVQDWKQVLVLAAQPTTIPGALGGKRNLDDIVFGERQAMGITG